MLLASLYHISIATVRFEVFVHARVRPKGTNAWQEIKLADVFTFRNGKVVQMRAFADRKEAFAGLAPLTQTNKAAHRTLRRSCVTP